jgi:hypothetical protein
MKRTLVAFVALLISSTANAEWLKKYALISMGENSVVEADKLRKAGKFDEFRKFCDQHHCQIWPLETEIVIEELRPYQWVKFHLPGREDIVMYATDDQVYLAPALLSSTAHAGGNITWHINDDRSVILQIDDQTHLFTPEEYTKARKRAARKFSEVNPGCVTMLPEGGFSIDYEKTPRRVLTPNERAQWAAMQSDDRWARDLLVIAYSHLELEFGMDSQ